MTTSIYTGGNFYVYLITDLNPVDEARYYIGSRTAKHLQENNVNPEDDPYMGSPSSEKTKEFQRRLKLQPKEFEKIVIKTFTDSKDCVKYEKRLQLDHDVLKNNLFYNQAIADHSIIGSPEATQKAIITKRNDVIDGLNSLQRAARKGIKTQLNTFNESGLNVFTVSTTKRRKTINDPVWKETVGKEAKRKELETKNDPVWKETVGKEAKRKELETKNDHVWKETVGKESYKQMVLTKQNDIDENGLNGHQRTGIKSSETKQNDIDENGLNGHQRIKQLRGHGVKLFIYKNKEFTSAQHLSNHLNNDISVPTLNVLSRVKFDKIITNKSYSLSKFLQNNYTRSKVVGLKWIDIGFNIVPWSTEEAV